MQAPAGIAVATLLLWLARTGGAGFSQLGLDPANVPRGIRAGLALGVPISTAMVIGAFLPWTARFFREDRIVQADAPGAAYELFVRIPLATAVTEEVIFRSALDSILSSRRPPPIAGLLSAAGFGAWHILPALDRTLSNPGIKQVHHGSITREALIVAGACALTAITGVGLSWLQRRSGSVVAPILVHYSINAGGFLGGWLASRRAGESSDGA
jgi:membrane protease YdiL (CAAX protease family)